MEQAGRETEKSKSASTIYTVDSFDNGIAFGQHRLEAGLDPRDRYCLGTECEGPAGKLRSRYALHRDNPFWELERNLMRLSRQGVLGSSTIYFGTTTDPFLPFDGKFDASMKFLQLFERYTPGLLVVQTRSPLVVIAMPVFKKLGRHAAVTIPVETHLEESVQKYTPGLPRIAERLKTANTLRNLGVEVTLQVAPVLPYGDWRDDAGEFAKILTENADFVHVKALAGGAAEVERQLSRSGLARKLAQDRKFHWLRHDSANPLMAEIEKIAPAKLAVPVRQHTESRQMSIFAA